MCLFVRGKTLVAQLPVEFGPSDEEKFSPLVRISAGPVKPNDENLRSKDALRSMGRARPLHVEKMEVAIMFESEDMAERPTVTPKANQESQIDPDLTPGSESAKRMHAIPKCGSLEGVTQISGSLLGIELATLVPFDVIAVRTVNSDYRIFLLDPKTGRALLEGGGQIPEPVEVRVVGSSFGGSILRTGWIGVGLRMEAWGTAGTYIRTSPVQSLCVAH